MGKTIRDYSDFPKIKATKKEKTKRNKNLDYDDYEYDSEYSSNPDDFSDDFSDIPDFY